MIGHPLCLVALAADLSALAAVAASGLGAFRVAVSWQPASAGAGQILLEARAEAASILGRTGQRIFTAASLLWLVALTTAMPPLVPGAMCGTGVLQAAAMPGIHAILYRVAAVCAFHLWVSVDGLNRRHPMSPLTRPASGLMLLVVPLAVMAAFSATAALMAMDGHRPVDCCMVVYDQFRSLAEAQRTAGLSNDTVWTGGFAALSIVLACAGLAVHRRPCPGRLFLMTAAALAWAPCAHITLTRSLSPYLYGVLHHHCPWCLFTASGAYLGFPLIGAAAVVMLEAVAAPAIWWLAVPVLGAPARHRVGRAGIRVTAATAAFAAIGAGPALAGYARWGLWITGGS